MSSSSKIEWTDAIWNPVTGCSKVSPGCKNCYAERLWPKVSAAEAKRIGQPARAFTDVRCHPERLDTPLHWRKPRRVFVNSMSDLFHESISVEFILAVWAVMEASPQHTYQILTKRADRMRSVLSVAPVVRQPNVPAGATVTYERREIPGWPGYYADIDGVIWSSRRGRLRPLSPCVTSKWGHAHVTLHAGMDATPQQIKVHRLVLTTFDRQSADGEEACHINGDAADNRAANLRWGSRADNSADRTAHGNAVTAPTLTIRQVADVRIAALSGEAHREIARRYDISHTQVARIVSGESWGFKMLPNCWLGVSVEDQATADERIPLLIETPAAVRFISAEPLLGPINLRNLTVPRRYGTGLLDALTCDFKNHYQEVLAGPRHGQGPIDWVIAGGESGPKARPSHPDWFRSIRDQCAAAGVPFCFKQWGEHLAGEFDKKQNTSIAWQDGRREWHGDHQDIKYADSWLSNDAERLVIGYRVGKKAAGRLLDGRTHDEYPA